MGRLKSQKSESRDLELWKYRQEFLKQWDEESKPLDPHKVKYKGRLGEELDKEFSLEEMREVLSDMKAEKAVGSHDINFFPLNIIICLIIYFILVCIKQIMISFT